MIHTTIFYASIAMHLMKFIFIYMLEYHRHKQSSLIIKFYSHHKNFQLGISARRIAIPTSVFVMSFGNIVSPFPDSNAPHIPNEP